MPTYVVYKGKVPGVYDDWEECRGQIQRFSDNSYKGYTTSGREEGAEEEPDEDQFHRDDAHRDRSSIYMVV